MDKKVTEQSSAGEMKRSKLRRSWCHEENESIELRGQLCENKGDGGSDCAKEGSYRSPPCVRRMKDYNFERYKKKRPQQ